MNTTLELEHLQYTPLVAVKQPKQVKMSKTKTHLILRISELFQDSANFTLLVTCLFACNGVYLARRTTYEDLDFITEGRGSDVLLDEIFVNVARSTCEEVDSYCRERESCESETKRLERTLPVGFCLVDGVDDV